MEPKSAMPKMIHQSSRPKAIALGIGDSTSEHFIPEAPAPPASMPLPPMTSVSSPEPSSALSVAPPPGVGISYGVWTNATTPKSPASPLVTLNFWEIAVLPLLRRCIDDD